MNGEDLLGIGAFALATGLTIPALRHYDEIGLLEPAQVDSDTGYRRYAHHQVHQTRLVCGLRAVDLPLAEIRAVMGGSAAAVHSALDAHRERLVAQVRELSQRVLAVDEFIEKGTPMPASQAICPAQIRINVADAHRAAVFYTTAFDVVFNEAISSLQFGTYRSDRFFLVTLEECGTTSSRPPGGSRFGLLVEDVDVAHERAVKAGAAEVHPPTDFTWKPRTSAVRDPDGNVVDLSQS